jgi:hypothetical protein
MTESEWLVCTDPKRMLAFRQGLARWRKRLLYGCACCRLVWQWLTVEGSRQAVTTCELGADGLAEGDELKASIGRSETAGVQAWQERQRLASELGEARRRGEEPESLAYRYREANVIAYAASAPHTLLRYFAWPRHRQSRFASVEGAVASASHAWRLAAWDSPTQRQQATFQVRTIRAGLLRDVFGNPFRRLPRVTGWRTPDVLSLAQAAYDERILPSGELDTTRLCVLADALEEAGCTDADLLAHLRSSGPHVRGCWVVDLLLGKERRP